MPKPNKPSKSAAKKSKPAPQPERSTKQNGQTPSGSALSVFVDYPAEGETVPGGFYTFRIGTVPAVEKVDVSVDGGPWQSCRSSEGYWWFDWIGEGAGTHRLIARATGADYNTALSDERSFKVG